MEYAGTLQAKLRLRRFASFYRRNKKAKRAHLIKRNMVRNQEYSDRFGKFAFTRNHASRSQICQRLQSKVRVQVRRSKCIESGKWATCLHANRHPLLCQSIGLERLTIWCKKRYLVIRMHSFLNGNSEAAFWG
jgi:hypothetical protein